MSIPYQNDADILSLRILALIPKHPEILDMEDPFDLFRIPGFSIFGMDVSLAQASWALIEAKTIYERHNEKMHIHR